MMTVYKIEYRVNRAWRILRDQQNNPLYWTDELVAEGSMRMLLANEATNNPATKFAIGNVGSADKVIAARVVCLEV